MPTMSALNWKLQVLFGETLTCHMFVQTTVFCEKIVQADDATANYKQTSSDNIGMCIGGVSPCTKR